MIDGILAVEYKPNLVIRGLGFACTCCDNLAE